MPSTPPRISTNAPDDVPAWIARNCTHTKGQWAGQPFRLAAWQEDDIVRPLFETLLPDGRRQFRTALIGVPRKNGKSALGAALALRMLFRDGEMGGEVYSAAADREQASIVFEMARGMVEANPAMARIAKVYRRAIVVPRTGSTYKVLSADAYTKHGLSPHAVLFDELHAQPNRELWDVLTTGQGARRQPLTIAITTAGYDRDSICWELYEYGRKVRDGLVDDPTFFFRWWGAEDGEDWEAEETWRRANPNLGVSIALDFLRSEARQAKHQPARQNTFRRLYCNQWTQQLTRWIDVGMWDASAGLVPESGLEGRPCYGGLDLAAKTDLVALCWDFPGEEQEHSVVWRFFVPEARLTDLDARTAGAASVWAREGYLRLTAGNVTDYDAILDQIDQDARRFDVWGIGADPWNLGHIAQDLGERGVPVIEIPQTITRLSGATKELERLVLSERYRHGGNPVMRWMVDNVVIRQDSSGNIKPDRERSGDKIDGVMAAVMALECATRDAGTAPQIRILGAEA